MEFRNKILQGNCIEVLKTLPDNSIDCCVTSPPYFGMRDYQTGRWEGGDENCSHKRDSKYSDKTITEHSNPDLAVGDAIYKSVCHRCGALRIDEQVGLEETPEEYVENMVKVFRGVKRVLKPTGTLWLNLGDSYWGGGWKGSQTDLSETKQGTNTGTLCGKDLKPDGNHPILKSKDLVGTPWRIAFALQADGWYLRQDIIWKKGNPMPESVTDRCTKSHEYIFLLSKEPKYYYDADAIKEKSIDKESYTGRIKRTGGMREGEYADKHLKQSFSKLEEGKTYETRNKRSVWDVNVNSYKEAHFATYPIKLIDPCIKAGVPKQVCSKCGKPIEYVINKEPIPEYCKTYLDGEAGDLKQTGSLIGRVTNSKYDKFIKNRKIEIEEVKCSCNAEFLKGIVLDPFMGSGTTAIVALNNKVDYVGIELNPDYIEIIEKRIDVWRKNDNYDIF